MQRVLTQRQFSPGSLPVMLGSKPVVFAALTNLVLPRRYVVLTALPTQPDKAVGARLALPGSSGAAQHTHTPHELCPEPPHQEEKCE